MAKPTLKVKVYGARGSYSPTIGTATQIGVNTTCLRMDIGNHIILFDAGSGIINAGQDLFQEFQNQRKDARSWKINLFFTHLHIDHLVGFPYFLMLYMPQTDIHFISPQILDYTLQDTLETFVHPPFFPVGMADLPFKRQFHQMKEHSIVYFYDDDYQILTTVDEPEPGWQAKISCMRNYLHPKGGAFFYRVETENAVVVFASDSEGFPGGDTRLINFAKDADLLFHDAQYTRQEYAMFQGFGHSTYEMACEVARKAGVKKLLLFHHDPKHSDKTLKEIEAAAQEMFPETYLASESMEFIF